MTESRASSAEYGLDPAHVQDVCRAETDDVNFTFVERPDRMYVSSRYRARDVLTVLRRVGYDAQPSPTNPDTVVVNGWSDELLRARIIALKETAERLEKTLPDAPARAIDAYAVRHGDPDIDAPGYQAAARIRGLLRRDVQAITGPHAPYDGQILPQDRHTEGLVRRARRWERRVDDLIFRHWMAACDAIDAYRDMRSERRDSPHESARHWAIDQVRWSLADAARRNATAGDEHHPVALASADRPARPAADDAGPTDQADAAGHHLTGPSRQLSLRRPVRGPAAR